MGTLASKGGVRRNLLSDQVVERLEELILGGGFEAGASLPSEAELVEQFGVSRAVIRDATRALAARGLVEVRQGKRPTVIGLNAGMPRDFFRMALRSDGSALLELVEVRRTLEVTNARLAAARADEADVQGMQRAIDAMKADVENPETYDEADLDFHERLAAASGNRFMRLLIEALGEPLRASRVESRRGHALRGMSPALAIEAHQKILDAVIAGDPGSAAREMESHLDVALEDLRAAREEETGTE
jgi:GntR family transcriptional repressor for pyruvate dehydrogenase complex